MRPACAGKTEKGKDRWFESTAHRLLAHTAPCRPMLHHRNLSCLLWTLRDAICWPAVDGSGAVNQHLPANAERSSFAEVTWSDVSEIVSSGMNTIQTIGVCCCGSRNAEWLIDSQLHHSGPIIDKA